MVGEFRECYVYALMDGGEMFYIGQGRGNRVNSHLTEALASNKNEHKLNKIRKANSLGTYSVEKLVEGLTERQAKSLEMVFINFWGRIDLGEGPLTNKTNGGDGAGGVIQSQESNSKRSETMSKLFEDEPWRRDQSSKNAHKANVTKRRNGGTSLETRQKQREAKLGFELPESNRQKLIASHLGKSLSQESRDKSSARHKGKTKTDKQKSDISIKTKEAQDLAKNHPKALVIRAQHLLAYRLGSLTAEKYEIEFGLEIGCLRKWRQQKLVKREIDKIKAQT